MVLQRIKAYIDYKGIKIAAFEKSIGMSNASFGKSLKNNGTIGADKLENILNTYSDLNPTWVLTGVGSMLKEYLKEGAREDFKGEVREDSAEYAREVKGKATRDPCPLCQEKEKVIAAQQRTIDILDRELHHCKVLYDEEREKGHDTRHDGQKRKVG